MSRLIKKSLPIPTGVTVTPAAASISFKGPKGEEKVIMPAGTEVKVDGAELWVKDGTTWALAKNALKGVTEGFEKTLEIEGVGYRAQIEGKELVLFLGYALPVRVPMIPGTTVTVEKNVIKVSGVNKELVGRAAAEIRALKKPEPYKGKGIHYVGEVIRRKVGKKAGATGTAA